jgi:hypothetical protein
MNSQQEWYQKEVLAHHNNMRTLYEYFELKKSISNDINEHLETFKRYSEECDIVIEMGVRGIVSTWGFLAGKPKKLIGIDLFHPSEFGGDLNEVYRVSSENNVNYEFRIQNSLECEIEECDLLFIDTWHDYLQLKKELTRHHKKVKKYIVLHDTISFGFKDESSYENYDQPREETNLPKGLNTAIDEFLNLNKNWYIHERFAHNNGITILKNLYV